MRAACPSKCADSELGHSLYRAGLVRTLTDGNHHVSSGFFEDKLLTEVTLLSAAENTLHNLINYWRVASVRF